MSTTPTSKRRGSAIGLLLSFLVAVAGLTGCSEDSPARLAGVTRTPPLEVGTASLPDARTGEMTPLRASPGGLLLVYFGYTSCPDICPTTLADLKVAIGDLDPAQAAKIRVAFATVDPERDTADVVQQYLGHFFPEGLPLRSDDATVNASVQKTFGVVAEIAPHAPGEDYEVGHTALTYVVDERGTVLVEWPFGLEPDAMHADLELLLEGKGLEEAQR